MNALLLFTVTLCAGAAVADVSHVLAAHKHIAIIKSASDITPEGAFQWGFETENGIAAQAQGDPSGTIRGSYSYPSPDGSPIQVTYTADAEGFHPEGNVVPETPPAILRALEWIKAHPSKESQQP